MVHLSEKSCWTDLMCSAFPKNLKIRHLSKFLSTFFALIKKNARKIGTCMIIIILLTTGCFLLFFGISEYSRVTYESLSSPRGIVILGDNDTIIEDMKIYVSESYRVIYYEEGWIGAIIDFNSSCKTMNLFFSMPGKIDYAHAINYTKTSFFYFNPSYNSSTDSSGLFLSYISSEDKNRMRIDFDWKIYEKISYDQWKVEIAFVNPYYGSPLFQEVQSAYGLVWFPEIDKLTIQIEVNHPVDLSYTNPQPSYYYLLDGRTSVYWTFDSRREISSVQAVFKDPVLSKLKSDTIFRSGLFTALGISIIFWGLKEVIDFLKSKEIRSVNDWKS